MTTPTPTTVGELIKKRRSKSVGQRAYECDVQRTPRYHDGTPRVPWEKLSKIAQRSWEQPPRQ